MKKGIIFDMDGTLWDSAANVAESWNLAIKQDGSVDKKLTEQDIQGVMGKTMDVIADILFPELEKEARMKLLDQCCSMENDYLREHGGVLYPKLEETLSALKEKYPLYIVSNCQSGYIEAFLDHYGFGKYRICSRRTLKETSTALSRLCRMMTGVWNRNSANT